MSMYTVQCLHCARMTSHPVIIGGLHFCQAKCYRDYWKIPTYQPYGRGTKANDRHRIHYGPGDDDHFDTEARYETG